MARPFILNRGLTVAPGSGAFALTGGLSGPAGNIIRGAVPVVEEDTDIPADAYRTPDGSDYYQTPDGSDYYAEP
jgi:hypothetical protein